MTDFMLIRGRTFIAPVCEATTGGRFCRRIAVSADPVAVGSGIEGLRSRCPSHASPDAPRVCTGCKAANNSRDPWHCLRCHDGGISSS